MDEENPHYIFWTAGFDSTFRLAQLLLSTDRPVQPLYVIDFDRRSAQLEMQRMCELRRELCKVARQPDSFLPTKIFLKNEFTVAPVIHDSFREISSKTHIGSQYEWLAQAASSFGLPDGTIELCMPRHDPPSGLQCEIFDDPHGEKPELKPGAAKRLFRYYSFPTLHLTKSDMRERARDLKIEHIMLKTWFCHSPIGLKPCGICQPCRIAKREREGIGYAAFGGVRIFARRVGSYLTRRLTH